MTERTRAILVIGVAAVGACILVAARWPWLAAWGWTPGRCWRHSTAARSWPPWQAAKLQRIAKNEFSAQFALSLALKDVHLALEAADDDRFATLARLADEWQQGVDQGLGDQDLTVVTRVIEPEAEAPRPVSDPG